VKKQLLQLEEGSKHTLLLMYAMHNSYGKDYGLILDKVRDFCKKLRLAQRSFFFKRNRVLCLVEVFVYMKLNFNFILY